MENIELEMNRADTAYITIKSKLLSSILRKCKDTYPSTEEFEVMLSPVKLTVEMDNQCIVVPTDLGELLECLIDKLFTVDERKNAESDEGVARNSREDVLREVLSSRNEIVASIIEAEAASQIITFGTDTARFNRNNYDADELERIELEIARKKRYNPSDVTQDDFEDYVADKIACETTMFVYNKSKNVMTTGHSFIIDDEE